MELKLEVYGSLCALSEFIINGVPADYYDFGEQEDTNPNNKPDYGCGYMEFIGKPANQEILDKYSISIDEYNEIVNQLKSKLTFGCCALCS